MSNGKKGPKQAKLWQPDEKPSKRWYENNTSKPFRQEEGSDSEVEESYDSGDGIDSVCDLVDQSNLKSTWTITRCSSKSKQAVTFSATSTMMLISDN